ncbi:hypothetical protein M0805_003742, partial [Coniferiporia weirii]
KALKVVDLKDLLARAGVPIPAKANKPDLIANIIASPSALDVFHETYSKGTKSSGTSTPKPAAAAAAAKPVSPVRAEVEKEVPAVEMEKDENFLAPPEPFDWSASSEISAATTAKPASKSATNASTKTPTPPNASTTTVPSSAVAPATSDGTNSVAPLTEDEEAAKRRARAERFGIPVVAPSKPSVTRGKKAAPTKDANAKKAPVKDVVVPDDSEKLNARAARFGNDVKPTTSKNAILGQKRSAPAEAVDAEELERRRKRAERFGTGPKV